MTSVTNAERVHFVGIGGAGMSAIAKVLLERGGRVSGSDLKGSSAATMLQTMGADVHIGHDGALVEGADVVVVSTAIPEGNPERRRAAELGIPVVSRGEALAAILALSPSLVIAGTHGKTTTTSMAVTIFRAAGLDPTYLVGGGLNDVGTNARFGRGGWALAESDESDGSFLLLAPTVAVVTNVEVDHVDHWHSFEEMRAAFVRFLASARPEGALVVCEDDRALAEEAGGERRILTFGSGGDVRAEDVITSIGRSAFTIVAGERSTPVELHVPGEHNVSNALAAAAACLAAGLDLDAIARGLAAFRGVERRFQVRGEANGVTIVDDYAHHPTEVKATLAAARPGPWRRVVAVFQPHRYSRTAAFAQDFGRSFAGADRIVITDVYGAGEQPVPGVSGKLIADAAATSLPGRPVAYLPHRGELLSFLERSIRPGDLVLTMGAGDITTVGEQLLARSGAKR